MIYRILQWWKDFWRGDYLGAARSPKWSQVRKEFLILHDKCEVCGKKSKLLKALEVHHCIPFSRDELLELDFNNLIILCREHHLLVGHLMSWFSFNPSVREDAALWNKKINGRPL